MSELFPRKIATASEDPSEIFGESESRNYYQLSVRSWELKTLIGFFRKPNCLLMLKVIGFKTLGQPENMSLSFEVSFFISYLMRSWLSSGKLFSSRVSSSGYSTGDSKSSYSCTGSSTSSYCISVFSTTLGASSFISTSSVQELTGTSV